MSSCTGSRGQLALHLDDATLSGAWRMVNTDQEIVTVPRTGLLRSIMMNHSYHHRRQLTVYLRQVGSSLRRYTVP